jgi:hypothetical protein
MSVDGTTAKEARFLCGLLLAFYRRLLSDRDMPDPRIVGSFTYRSGQTMGKDSGTGWSTSTTASPNRAIRFLLAWLSRRADANLVCACLRT